jgi:outer membrane lipopolysaccharide assembly protein LptE/RlpB
MKSSTVLLLPVFALILSGCMGYRTGSTLPESIQTVSLSIVNETDEPSIEVQVMRSLRAELQQDGRLEVRSQNDADAVLNVKLTRYTLSPLAYDRVRGTLAREYRLTLTAAVVLYDAKTGAVILESPVLKGDSEFPYAEDLTTAKLGALPAAADDLARKVVSTTVTAW